MTSFILRDFQTMKPEREHYNYDFVNCQNYKYAKKTANLKVIVSLVKKRLYL